MKKYKCGEQGVGTVYLNDHGEKVIELNGYICKLSEMTENQKRELERQANNYSYDYFERKLHGYSTDIPNARLIALFMAVEVLGYEFKTDHEESF